MKVIFLSWGLIGLAITLCFVLKMNWATKGLIMMNILSLWYLVPGTISSGLQIILLLIKKIPDVNCLMKYNLERSCEILERTPILLKTLLTGLSDEWINGNEGPETFSSYDVVGHLIHGEKTDWRDRATMILEHGVSKTFVPYDRFAQYEESKGKNLQQLLDEFEALRLKNMKWFRSLNLSEADLDKKGIHPSLGQVTMRQLLSTWVIHDLTHIAQVTRVMAKQYKEEMGPWIEFFRIMNF